jgi:hypothetical protein
MSKLETLNNGRIPPPGPTQNTAEGFTRKEFIKKTTASFLASFLFVPALQATNSNYIEKQTSNNEPDPNKYCKTRNGTIYIHKPKLVNRTQLVSEIYQNRKRLTVEENSFLLAIHQLRLYEKLDGSHFMFMPASKSIMYIIDGSTIIAHKMQCLRQETKEWGYPASIHDILLPTDENINNPEQVIQKSYLLSTTSVYYPVKENGKRTRIQLVNTKYMRSLDLFCLYQDHLLILNNWNSDFYVNIFDIKTKQTVKEIPLQIERRICRIDTQKGQPVIIGQKKIYYLNIPDLQKKSIEIFFRR